MDQPIIVASAAPNEHLIVFKNGVKGCLQDIVINLNRVNTVIVDQDAVTLDFSTAPGTCYDVQFNSIEECWQAYEWIMMNYCRSY